MASAVCVDIGSKSLKILQLEQSGGNLKMTHFSNFELPLESDFSENPDILIEPINQIFREHDLDRNNVVLSLPAQDCILREITVEFEQDEQIRQIIKYEAEKYLHSYPIEDVIIDYQKLSTKDNKSKLFVVAVPKSLIAQRLDILEKCDIDPLFIDLDASALVNVVSLCPDAANRKSVILVDFGTTSTKIVIASEQKVHHVRATRLGTSALEEQFFQDTPREDEVNETVEDIDWEIENKLIISLPVPDGASQNRMVLVRSEETAQQEKLQEIYDRLMKEIRRTLFTLKIESPVELLCLTGSGAQLEGLAEYIQERLGLDTIFLDFSSQVEATSDVQEDFLLNGAICLGCAMRALGRGSVGMDFRKEEFTYTNRFELIKFPLSLLVTLVFLVLLLLTVYVQSSRITKEKTLRKLVQERALPVYQRVYPNASAPGKLEDSVYQMRRRMSFLLEGEADPIPPVPEGLKRWRAIFDAFGQVSRRYEILLTHFTLQEEQATLRGKIKGERYGAAFDQLKREFAKLKKLVHPEKIELLPESRNDPNGYNQEFTINLGFLSREELQEVLEREQEEE